MARSTATGKDGILRSNGFTLIEMLTVVSLIGILATLAVPSYQASVLKAREAALRQDLFTLRDVLDQHRADQGKYPPSLRRSGDGVSRTIRGIPLPTGSTWRNYRGDEEGVIDVFSGSESSGRRHSIQPLVA